MPIPSQRTARGRGAWLAALVVLALPAACASTPERSLDVLASAYNSSVKQADDRPSEGAWGDSLEPGMQAIAVSRDLLDLGLTRGTRVRIDGLAGEFVVLDKMGRRWTRKIDIYMGDDVGAAKRWGVRPVRIHWRSPLPAGQ